MVVASVLGGTLQRLDDGAWSWSDGTVEPRVHDMSASGHYNFRCRTDGSGQTYVEVLRQLAEGEPDLAWVLAGETAGVYQMGASGDHFGPLVLDTDGPRRMAVRPGEDPLTDDTVPDRRDVPIPSVILVPVADWDAWARSVVIGAEWDRVDETAILAKAKSLGWRG